MLLNLSEFLSVLPPGRLTRADLICAETLLDTDGDIAVHFVPFGYFPRGARLVLLGLTPGFEQMRLAYEAARDYHRHARDADDLYRHCGAAAGFGGPMRQLLVSMLDDIGIAEAMGIPTAAALFEPNRSDVIRCSVLRHPVFIKRENYTGHKPRLTTSPFLLQLIKKYFAVSIAATPTAVIVPMGNAVQSVLRDLRLPNPVLWGFPHPSPGNGHRVRQFNANRKQLRESVCRLLSA
jgi:hypothetical protein